MPYGKPYSEEERRERHLSKYGSLENFPKERKGEGTFWKEKEFSLDGWGVGYKGEYILTWGDVFERISKKVGNEQAERLIPTFTDIVEELLKKAGFKVSKVV